MPRCPRRRAAPGAEVACPLDGRYACDNQVHDCGDDADLDHYKLPVRHGWRRTFTVDETKMDRSDLTIPCLGPCRLDSPMRTLLSGESAPKFVSAEQRVLIEDRFSTEAEPATSEAAPAGFELAGPRERIYFDTSKLRCGIVTCGGLSPGLNDVIRGLVMVLWHRYGVRQIVGFRYGLQGFIPRYGHPVVELEPAKVLGLHQTGGSVLGTSRGPQDAGAVVDCLDRMNIRVLFVVGGDGTMRAALSIAEQITQRGLKIAVLGIPKTIDNDIPYVDLTFGFHTAYSEAVESIRTAHVEATGSPHGVGLVKLMGRQSGFIACHATLASGEVNFTLIPEVPFSLAGDQGLLAAVERRVQERGHAVIVVAEGAGQELLAPAEEPSGVDASGNPRLGDIGAHLRTAIADHFADKGWELNLKYLDPSYDIRSVPASPPDSIYCLRLAQSAVHAAMCGKTEMVVGRWHGSFVHVPMRLTVGDRKQVDPRGELWLSVLEDTGQPVRFG